MAELKERNREIYKRWKRGKLGYKKLAKFYGLHYTTIANIIRREERRKKVGR